MTRRPEHPRQSDKSGLGLVLVVVLVLLFAVAVVTIGRSHFSSYVADRTSKGVFGDLALALAEDALTEARFRLGSLANDPASPVFDAFRSNGDAFTVEIPLDKLPQLKKSLDERRKAFRLSGDKVSLRVDFQAPVSLRLPTMNDRCGLLTLSAEVRHGPSSVSRRLEETYDYRVNLTAPPVPFAFYTFFVADAVFLVNGGSPGNDANACMDKSLARLAEIDGKNEEFIKNCAEAVEAIRRARSRALHGKSKFDRAIRAVQQAKGMLEALRASWPSIQLLPFGTDTSAPGCLHHFPAPPVCVFTFDDDIDLKDLDLPDKVTARIAAIAAAESRLGTAAKACHDFLKGKPGNLSPLPGLIDAYCKAARETADEYKALLLVDYKGFQDRLVEIAGPPYSEFLPFIEQMYVDDLRRKATAVVGGRAGSPGAAGTGVQEAFDGFLDRLDGFSGLLFVSNPPQAELVIDRVFKGRTVLVVAGDARIRKAVLADKTMDRLTIICFGRLRVEGRVEACLMPWLGFESSDRAEIEGNLVFSRLNFTAAPPARVLCGKLSRDSRFGGSPSRPGPDDLYVTVGPSPVFVSIARK